MNEIKQSLSAYEGDELEASAVEPEQSIVKKHLTKRKYCGLRVAHPG